MTDTTITVGMTIEESETDVSIMKTTAVRETKRNWVFETELTNKATGVTTSTTWQIGKTLDERLGNNG